MEENVNTDSIYIDEIQKDVAKNMIVKNHYSHAWSMCNVALGIYYKTGQEHEWFSVDEDSCEDVKLIGCLIYGSPVGRHAIKSISPLLEQGEVFELTRLWVADGYGRNLESFVIAKSFQWLKENKKDIKVLVSYADPNAGHLGRIYQATNWMYQELDDVSDTDVMVSLTGPPHYEWMHPRTIVAKLGSRSQDSLPRPYWKRIIRRKFRYIYLLYDKKEKKERKAKEELLKSLVHPISPYPKNLEIKDEVIKVD